MKPDKFSRRKFLKGFAFSAASYAFTSRFGSQQVNQPVHGQPLTADKPLFLPYITQIWILLVGPTRSLKTPSAASQVAKDGVVIQIDAGLYSGDTATWRQNNLTIQGLRPVKSRG